MWQKFALLVAVSVVFSACAGSRTSHKGTHQPHYRAGHYAIPKSDIPLVVNDRVVAWVDYFTGPGRDRFSRYMKRSGRYTPMIRQILKSYGLPQDLIYLAMIESGFATKAKSHASAVGVWQFIRATGNRYGLDQDSWIDERQDAEKATHAAAQYLRDLYNEFGDWYLAMAAYNSGEGTVRRGIARTGTKDFWRMSEPRTGVFRAETRDYVPKFIAAAIVAKHPEQFGLANVLVDAPISYETVVIDTHVDIDIIAKCAGVDVETVDILNSELKIGTAPPQYKVKLPPGTAKKFQVALARIPAEDRVSTVPTFGRYTVAKRDTLGGITKRFGVKPSKLLAANGLRNARAVKPGMTLTIPGSDLKSTLIARAGYKKGSATPGFVTVRRGDTLKSLSEKYDVSVADLRDWNNLNGRHSSLKVGSRVRIQSPDAVMDSDTSVATSALVAKSAPTMPVEPRSKSGTQRASINPVSAPAIAAPVASADTVASGYVVSAGDSWNTISQNVGLSTKQLKQLNPDLASSGLHVGDVLRLSDSPKQVAEAANDVTSVDAVATDVPVRPVEQVVVDTVEVDSPITKVPAAKTSYYKVRPGDSLDKIAQRHGVTVGDLREWNQISKGHIRPGQKLMVMPPAQAKQGATRVGVKSAKAETAKPRANVVTYKVKPGDNLWTIGKKHKISSDQMKQLSQMNKSLRPGDVITFRAGS